VCSSRIRLRRLTALFIAVRLVPATGDLIENASNEPFSKAADHEGVSSRVEPTFAAAPSDGAPSTVARQCTLPATLTESGRPEKGFGERRRVGFNPAARRLDHGARTMSTAIDLLILFTACWSRTTVPSGGICDEGARDRIRTSIARVRTRRCLSAVFINTVTHRRPRSARPARREEREDREYSTDEQDGGTGCIGGRMPPYL
jgi:hypothetical protein